MQSQPLAYDTTVKVDMTHNISSLQMAEVRLDITMTVFQVKSQVEKRYGSDANFINLILKDKAGNVLHRMTNDGALFGSYNPKDGYIIHVEDTNPNSVLKGLNDVSKVQKFALTEDQYDKVPDNFRKFKKDFIKTNVGGDQAEKTTTESMDDDFEKDYALQISIGSRCQLLNGDHRGTIRYVGQVPQMGLGYFVGVQLDEPYGGNNGSIKGYNYFQCPLKYGIFVRPSEIVIGDFPEADLDEI